MDITLVKTDDDHVRFKRVWYKPVKFVENVGLSVFKALYIKHMVCQDTSLVIFSTTFVLSLT
jgi:hypothetical protein